MVMATNNSVVHSNNYDQPPDSVRHNSVYPKAIQNQKPLWIENDSIQHQHHITLVSQDEEPQNLAHSWHYPIAAHTKGSNTVQNDNDMPNSQPNNILQPPKLSPLGTQSQPISRRGSMDNMETNFHKFTKGYLIPAAKWAYSPISKINKSKSKKPDAEGKNEYTIEYSAFRPVKNLPVIASKRDLLVHFRRIVEDETGEAFDFPENYFSDRDFHNLITQIIYNIEVESLSPQRIALGSSGSYFIFNKRTDGTIYKAGVFKPKDEEPYGPLSPKWSKWAHRTFFPCCFGRSCLIPNLGYISEAGACVLDRQLCSYIVPRTDIIELRSPSFFYSYWDKNSDVTKLPPKIGSFQVFLEGYTTADVWLRHNPIPSDPIEINHLKKSSDVQVGIDTDNYDFRWSLESMSQFQQEVEKLVILDYIMRNTDRGLDNWMIKLTWKQISHSAQYKVMRPIIKIGAIDSGLAFPWKHPDEWRSFPFGWLFLPYSIIGQPFSMKTRNHYLPLLTSKTWWEETVANLKQVFIKDQDFKERMWLKQLAVLKGQAFNVVEILKLGYAGPLELARRENLLVFDDVMYMPENIGCEELFRMQTSMYEGDISKSYDINSPLLPPSTVHTYLATSKVNNYLRIVDTDRDGNDAVANESGYEHIIRDVRTGDRAPGSKRVIIERLVKETSKPPVFTWC
ncbi:LSB6 [[Candida] subhashii]|uniref:Phosphatidylinositol 4-kinase n=1 Tax=[Candida] subhashii TaxID=561895 RepID=A0A8J5UJC0_9ASCO|nr:LSB6 [[Candida] subhashii]KAG7661036.1 LSB6 [[Candida] subhashii]